MIFPNGSPLAELSAILEENDFDRNYIKGILDSLRRNHSAADLDDRSSIHHDAAKLVADSISYFEKDLTDGPRIFVLVGPTGVGKTTTIAKLAAVHGLSGGGSDVRIITVDSFRIGARAQVETYGEIMGIPVKAVDDYDELRRQIALASEADLILVDTIGKSPRDTEKIEEMIADESYNRILELDWIKADVDGDGKMELVLGGDKAGTSAPQNIYGLMMDNSYKEQNSVQRYYVDGKLYETWDNVPTSYKLDLVVDNTPSIEDTYIRLDF